MAVDDHVVEACTLDVVIDDPFLDDSLTFVDDSYCGGRVESLWGLWGRSIIIVLYDRQSEHHDLPRAACHCNRGSRGNRVPYDIARKTTHL